MPSQVNTVWSPQWVRDRFKELERWRKHPQKRKLLYPSPDYFGLARSCIQILDVGCGWGALYFYRKDQFMNKRYVGVDGSRAMIRLAKQLSPEVLFLQGDARHLPFSTNSFEAVTSYGMVRHLKYAEWCLAEMFRVARKIVVLTALVGPNKFTPFKHVRDIGVRVIPLQWITKIAARHDFAFHSVQPAIKPDHNKLLTYARLHEPLPVEKTEHHQETS